MTKITFLVLFGLLALASCDSTKKSNSSSSTSTLVDCSLYPTSTYCTSSSTTGNTSTSCTGNYYYCTQGCGGYSATNAASSFCSGYTTGTTTGGTTTTSCTGKNYYCLSTCGGYSVANAASTYCSGVADTTTPATYGVKYPAGVPTGTCSTATATSTSGTYEPRVARVMIAGHMDADPSMSTAASYLNTDPEFMYMDYAKSLFISDSKLKVRFKVNPQPNVGANTTFCYGRATGQATTSGYTFLQYTVTLKGWDANNNLISKSLGTFVTGVNSCSSGIDLSAYLKTFPNGMYLTITNVLGNQNCTDSATTGYSTCQAYKIIRQADCWTLDVQVAADETKTF